MGQERSKRGQPTNKERLPEDEMGAHTWRGGLGFIRFIQEQCYDITEFGEKSGNLFTFAPEFPGYLSRRVFSADFRSPFGKPTSKSEIIPGAETQSFQPATSQRPRQLVDLSKPRLLSRCLSEREWSPQHRRAGRGRT